MQHEARRELAGPRLAWPNTSSLSPCRARERPSDVAVFRAAPMAAETGSATTAAASSGSSFHMLSGTSTSARSDSDSSTDTYNATATKDQAKVRPAKLRAAVCLARAREAS